jgi:hypothetical protein
MTLSVMIKRNVAGKVSKSTPLTFLGMRLDALQRVLDAQLCPRCRLLAQRRNLLRRGPVRAKAELIDDVTEIVVVCILEVGHLVGSDLSTRQRQSGTRKRSVIETAGRRAGTWTHQFLDLHHVVLEGLAGREVQVNTGSNDATCDRSLSRSRSPTLLTFTRPAIRHPSVFCSFILSIHPSSTHCECSADHPYSMCGDARVPAQSHWGRRRTSLS